LREITLNVLVIAMADVNFFKNCGPFSANDLAEHTQSKIIGDATVKVTDINTLESAKSGEISFFSNSKYKRAFAQTKASVCICDDASIELAPRGMTLLVNSNPYAAYALVTQKFYKPLPAQATIAKTAVLDASASIGVKTHISDFAVIGRNVKIGSNCFIGANTVLCDGVSIGDNTKIMHNVTISHTLIGNNCAIYSGCRIGQDGFGYAPSSLGITKVEQLGRVVIGNHVEIGANSTIDRGAIEDTIIGDGTKIDNLVQIGHNVQIGRNCFIVAQVGIAGSVIIEDGVMIGGQSGIAGHLTIGKGCMLAAKSGIMSDLEPGSTVGGSPAVPVKQWLRITAMLKKMSSKEQN